ncbi:amidohydrolase family protein [Flavihumibacter sp. R14]|nr:amidohydrolase family protein [Flavihumibacter soli]
MILNNLDIIGQGKKQCIRLADNSIREITDEVQQSVNDLALNFENAIAFPGLINSHDHLDFNCFPRLGNHRYGNYVDWGIDIHSQNKEQIKKVLKIPQELRIKWGIYKNLLNGITTVVNHGAKLDVENDLISVFQECHSIHSVRLDKYWKIRLNLPRKDRLPFVSHVGEGTDTASNSEINELLRWNISRRELIGVHGVSMDKKQAAKFSALVWSPDSNFFLLNKTASVDELKKHCTILFGTDSALTGSWNLFEQLRIARATGMASDEEIYNMLTTSPAKIWNLKDRGSIEQGMRADLVVAKQQDKLMPLDSFFNLNPEDILLVVTEGDIKLFDESLIQQLKDQHYSTNSFSSILINKARKFVKGNLPEMMKMMESYNPEILFPVQVS